MPASRGVHFHGARKLSVCRRIFAHPEVGSWVLLRDGGIFALSFRLDQRFSNGDLFFYVGLELKREFTDGELSDLRRATLPLLGAAGGMAAPALIYVAMNAGSSGTLAGWGVPMATDIAFALGALSLLGNRVPPSLKVFLLALAIVDDLGAVLAIALFYGDGFDVAALTLAAVCFAVGLSLNRAGVRRLWPYLVLAIPLWFAMHASGVHATVAGVLLSLTIPYRTKATRGLSVPPLLFLEHKLREVVMFGIMPVFALANAGVSLGELRMEDVAAPVTLGVALGLFIGKPLGIVSFTLIAARLLKAPLPHSLFALLGIGWISGIGFTMSLFISGLAFADPRLMVEARLGVLAGSMAAGIMGVVFLASSLHDKAASAQEERDAVTPFLVEDQRQGGRVPTPASR